MEWDSFPPPSQLPALIAKKDPNLNLGQTVVQQPVRRVQHRVAEQQRALANVKVRQALSYAINRDQHHPGARRTEAQPAADPRAAAGHRRLREELRPLPLRRGQGQAAARRGGLPERADAEVPLPQRVRGQQQDLPDRPAGPVQGRRQRRRRARRRTPTSTRSTCRCPPSPSAASGTCRWPGWGSDWYGNAALSFFNPLFSGKPSFPPIGSNFGLYDNPATNALIEQATTAPRRRPGGDRCGRRPTSRS